MKIQQKRSAALDGSVAKEPTAAQTDYGEVCVNFNALDPALFIRDNADQYRPCWWRPEPLPEDCR